LEEAVDVVILMHLVKGKIYFIECILVLKNLSLVQKKLLNFVKMLSVIIVTEQERKIVHLLLLVKDVTELDKKLLFKTHHLEECKVKEHVRNVKDVVKL